MRKYETYTGQEHVNLDSIDINTLIDSMNATMTLIQFIDVWLKAFKANSVRTSTYDRLVTTMTVLSHYAIAEMKICDISFFDIQNYMNQLVSSGYSMSTIKKQVEIVTAPLRQAASLKIINCDPTVGIKLPLREHLKQETKDVSAYDKDEQARLLSIIDNTSNSAYLCCAFMIETGLRVGEALALRWNDINFEQRKVSVHATVVRLESKKLSYVQNMPKTHSSIRVVPLTDKAIQILFCLRVHATSEWVFEDNGERLTYAQLRYRSTQLCIDAGVEYRGQHVYRHTFATNCYYRGVDVKVLSKLLGHADVNTTYNIYINLYGDGFNEMYKALVG